MANAERKKQGKKLLAVERLGGRPVAEQRVEIVERKGLGHPDTICDAVHEQISVDLCGEYENRFGRVLHHNIDKGLLVAGSSEPKTGGGRMISPMRLVIGDRATAEFQGEKIDVASVVESSVARWVRRNLRFVEPGRDLVLQNELKPGSAQLSDIFARATIGANDTSAAVGYAPMTETERTVLAAERFLNDPEFKKQFPEAGEDVKVMGCRRDRSLSLTVALAFVDRFVPDAKTYFERKEQIRQELEKRLAERLEVLDEIEVSINTLDDPGRGDAGMYLTVLGTSADGADCGQVGRGNRVNGLIALNRPSGNEAAAGKNPVSHVGKIYNLLTHRMAEEIHRQVAGVREVYVWLCSQIGRPLDQPLTASASLRLEKDARLSDVSPAASEIMESHLRNIDKFTSELAAGGTSVC